ncbi:MAG: hypothetical protein HY302_10670 [Opitutae bacterium]|nr:hypothetical protein [Opitutae bacterium]
MGNTVTAELVHHEERRDRMGRRHVPAVRRRELLAMFYDSGLTRQAFARRERIRYTTFCTWVQREGKTGVRPKAPKPVRPPQRINFAEACLPGPVALPVSAPCGLEVRLPDGTVVRGGRAEELAALVRALRS